MTREGLPEEVTFPPTPEHEEEPAVRTQGNNFPGRRHSRVETGPSLGFKAATKGTLSEGYVGEMGGRKRGVRRAVLGVG